MTVQENPHNHALLLASLAQIFRRTSPSYFSTPVRCLTWTSLSVPYSPWLTCPTGGSSGTSGPGTSPSGETWAAATGWTSSAGLLQRDLCLWWQGASPERKIEGFFQQGKGKLTLHAAFRWAVVISDDLRMMLGLYALPASLTTLEGNPVFKGWVKICFPSLSQ